MEPPRVNVTLSLPQPLLRKFRVYAAERNTSMSALMSAAIAGMLSPDNAAAANQRLLDRFRNAPDLGTGGNLPWTREQMHER